MADKVIIVAEGFVKNSNGKDWVELKDAEGKSHRVFQSIQDENDEWIHLENEISMLKAKIEDGSITNLPLRITKQKKGQYWNVVAVELVKDALEKKAIEKVKVQMDEGKNRSYALAYAKDIAVAKIMMGGSSTPAEIITIARLFESYLDNSAVIKEH